MNGFLQWLLPSRPAIDAPSTLPAAFEAEPSEARLRAEATVRAWLAEGSGGLRIVGCRELRQPRAAGAGGDSVFEFALGARVAHPALQPRRVVARCLDPDHVGTIGRRQVAMQAAADALGGPLAVPLPLRVDTTHGVLLQSAARGRCLAEHANTELPALLRGVERCGEALRELHELPTQLLGEGDEARKVAPVSIAAHVAGLMRPVPFMLAGQCPPLRRRVVQVTQDLIGAEAACGLVAAVPLHRQLDPGHVFVTPSRIEFIDWELCGAGDAALDLASFMMDVDRRWPVHAEALHAGLLRGWLAGGRHVPVRQPGREHALATRLHLYRAFHALRRACKTYRLECAGLPGATAHAEPAVPLGALALRRIAAWLEAAEQHLQACNRSVAAEGLSFSRLATEAPR